MTNNYRSFFGLKKEPFGTDLKIREILETDELKAVKKRLDYTVRLGGAALVTGEIGSGKSTALRYCAESLHPSEHKIIYVTATSGSILELYRQITAEMGIYQSSNSRALMTRFIKNEIKDLVDGKKMKVVLIIDEASLLRMEVLSELHTLCQFHKDSKPWLPLVMAGQSALIDKMTYRASAPLASRIVARSHMEGLNRQGMLQYLVPFRGIDVGGESEPFRVSSTLPPNSITRDTITYFRWCPKESIFDKRQVKLHFHIQPSGYPGGRFESSLE